MNKPATKMANDISLAKEILYIKKWMVNGLCIYPIVSKGLMSQIMQGCSKTSTPWQFVLDELAAEGVVYKYRKLVITIAGRQQYLTLYRLTASAMSFIAEHLPNQDPDIAMKIHLFGSSSIMPFNSELSTEVEVPELEPNLDIDPGDESQLADLRKRYVDDADHSEVGPPSDSDEDDFVSGDFYEEYEEDEDESDE